METLGTTRFSWLRKTSAKPLFVEPLRVTKGQVVIDFIIDHTVIVHDNTCLVEVRPWSLFFMARFVVRGKGLDVSLYLHVGARGWMCLYISMWCNL
jgi:hypothetical protein